MIRKSRELSKDATQRSATCHHPINSYKMSTTTTLKSHNTAQMAAPPTTVPLFNNNGCCGGFGSRRTKTNTAAAAASVMTSLAADLCRVAKTKQTMTSATATTTTMPTTPAMDAAVVVNSIIYSKPSFCSIVVDIGGKETTAPPLANKIQNIAECISPPKPLLNDQSNIPIPKANEGKSPLIAIPPHPDDAAHVYMMSTILNGSIHHHISELCDNLIAMGLFGMVENNNSEHDDESLIEFSYNDNDDDDDDEDEDEDDIEFLHTDEDVKRQWDYDDYDDDECEDLDEDDDSDCDSDEDGNDDDYYNNNNIEDYETDEDETTCLNTCDGGQDVTDFCRGPLMVTKSPGPLFQSEKKKKVRFNIKPTVHVMRTWDYAYRAARKGEWEMYARDRERFKLRIQRTAPTLNPILNREHRQKVYEQRFSKLYTKDKEKEKEKEIDKEKEDVEKNNIPEDSSPKNSPPKTKEEINKNNNQNQKKKKHHKKKKRKRRRPNF